MLNVKQYFEFEFESKAMLPFVGDVDVISKQIVISKKSRTSIKITAVQV
jgi:hypothetical protein